MLGVTTLYNIFPLWCISEIIESSRGISKRQSNYFISKIYTFSFLFHSCLLSAFYFSKYIWKNCNRCRRNIIFGMKIHTGPIILHFLLRNCFWRDRQKDIKGGMNSLICGDSLVIYLVVTTKLSIRKQFWH